MTGTRWGGAVLALIVMSGAACGDDDDGESSGGGEVEEFCTTFEPLNDEGDVLFSQEETPSSDEIQDLLDRMRELDPPAEIAEDFALVISAFQLLADGVAGDTDAQTELDDRLEEFEAADERLEPFMRDECGLEYGDDD